ncbi:MAG TPA: copper resistance CopC family protein [Steroidobacteraceae bacterium]|nr:copper resistance CopC family protein [Steroidobacteraceae bacterium]
MSRRLWLLCAALGLPLLAVGHAKLLATSPPAGARLAAAPHELTLEFNEAVQLGVLKLSAGGAAIPLKLERGAPAGREVRVALPALAAGTYQVQWSALTVDDGHVVKGTFSFVVAPAG